MNKYKIVSFVLVIVVLVVYFYMKRQLTRIVERDKIIRGYNC